MSNKEQIIKRILVQKTSIVWQEMQVALRICTVGKTFVSKKQP